MQGKWTLLPDKRIGQVELTQVTGNLRIERGWSGVESAPCQTTRSDTSYYETPLKGSWQLAMEYNNLKFSMLVSYLDRSRVFSHWASLPGHSFIQKVFNPWINLRQMYAHLPSNKIVWTSKVHLFQPLHTPSTYLETKWVPPPSRVQPYPFFSLALRFSGL